MIDFEFRRIAFLSGKNAYYNAGKLIAETSTQFDCAAKTPSLYLRTEQHLSAQQEYVRATKPKIVRGKLKFRYVASWCDTIKHFNEMVQKNIETAKDSFSQLEELIKLENFGIRFLDRNQFHSVLIGDKYTAIPWKNVQGKSDGCIIFESNGSPFREWFQNLYDNAVPFDNNRLEILRRKIST